MNRSIINQRYLFSLLILAAALVFAPESFAQQEEISESKSVSISTTAEGKVQLKVVIKNGNDETTFEKTYDSHDEMYNDPDLEKYGIDLGFGGNAFGNKPQFYFHNGPAGKFWNDEDFEKQMESLRKQMEEMTDSFGGSGFFFDFDEDNFMDMDSLIQRFQFRNDNGKFFFNGEEIMDLDSLEEAMKDRFDQFQFDFDFDDWDDEDFNVWRDKDDDVRIITRAKVYVRSAREEDKALVGTDEMESLQLNDISFYPNPSDGRFDIELNTPSDAPVQLIIVDDNGNEVYNKLSTPSSGWLDQRIDLTPQGKGLYVLKVIQNGKALTKRIIVE